MQYGAALAIQSFILLIAYLQRNWWLTVIAFIFGICVLLVPPLSHFVDRFWAWIGKTLARIVNPITLTILYIFIICPFGILARRMKWLNPAFNQKSDSQFVTIKKCPSQKSFSKPF